MTSSGVYKKTWQEVLLYFATTYTYCTWSMCSTSMSTLMNIIKVSHRDHKRSWQRVPMYFYTIYTTYT